MWSETKVGTKIVVLTSKFGGGGGGISHRFFKKTNKQNESCGTLWLETSAHVCHVCNSDPERRWMQEEHRVVILKNFLQINFNPFKSVLVSSGRIVIHALAL